MENYGLWLLPPQYSTPSAKSAERIDFQTLKLKKLKMADHEVTSDVTSDVTYASYDGN